MVKKSSTDVTNVGTRQGAHVKRHSSTKHSRREVRCLRQQVEMLRHELSEPWRLTDTRLAEIEVEALGYIPATSIFHPVDDVVRETGILARQVSDRAGEMLTARSAKAPLRTDI